MKVYYTIVPENPDFRETPLLYTLMSFYPSIRIQRQHKIGSISGDITHILPSLT